MPRQRTFALGSKGYIEDQPPNTLTPDFMVSPTQDVVIRRGYVSPRQQFRTLNLQQGSETSYAVAEEYFQHLSDPTTRRLLFAGDSDGSSSSLYYDASGTWTKVRDFPTQMRRPTPRCMYRGELIICDRDGDFPLQRYSGGIRDNIEPNHGGATNPTQIYAGNLNIGSTDAASWSAATRADESKGLYSFLRYRTLTPRSTESWARMDECTVADPYPNTEDIYHDDKTGAATDNDLAYWAVSSTAPTIPCVETYNEGRITTNASGQFTGATTSLIYSVGGFSGGAGHNSPALAVKDHTDGNKWKLLQTIVLSDKSTSSKIGLATALTDAEYMMLKRATFTDACTYQGRLIGLGVKEHPNRLYSSPVGWNPSIPPGAIPPWHIKEPFEDTDPTNLILDWIEVPSATDGEPLIACAPFSYGGAEEPSGVLAIKSDSVYALTGTPGGSGWFPQLLTKGAGAFELRAVHYGSPYGIFMAGRNGIFQIAPGGLSMTELTSGALRDWWMSGPSLDFGYGGGNSDRCVVGEHDGHLFVSVRYLRSEYGYPEVERTLVYDLVREAWVGDWTNADFQWVWRKLTPNEASTTQMLAVVHNDDRVIQIPDARPGTGITTTADPNEPTVTTGGMYDDDPNDTQDYHLVDVAIEYSLTDDTADSGDLHHWDVEAILGGGYSSYVDSDASTDIATKTLGTIDGIYPADDYDEVRYKRFRVRRSCKHGSLQFTYDVGDAVSPTSNKLYKATFVLDDSRERS